MCNLPAPAAEILQELPDRRLVSCYTALQTQLTFSTLPASVALLHISFTDNILHHSSKYSSNLLLQVTELDKRILPFLNFEPT